MIATFPHMGPLSVTMKTLLSGLGITVLMPPPTSKKTIETGAKYAPETACLPLKVTLGNYIEALDAGADTIVTCGGVGPCRLGYYAQVQQEILKELGYKFTMVAIEPNAFDVIKTVRQLAPGVSLTSVYRAFKLAGAKMSAIDTVGDVLRQVRATEQIPGTADAVYQEAVAEIEVAADPRELQVISDIYQEKLIRVNQHGQLPLRIGLVGEIYVMLESFVNQDLEQRLGRLGAHVHRTMSLTDYVRTHLLRSKPYMAKYHEIAKAAKPYLSHGVGGHGLKSIGSTVDLANQGFDGIVHVFPFTCMPEIIAKNILHQASDDHGIPVLSLAFDEQSGEAGVVTRLEAFIDLLNYRRQL
ncbi:acyl-CoA dehydratase activase-related protein [Sporomusa malonica]|uniref:Predicted nucleotide-binding protein, sugar kinase/HSP70/actin superfamily n=1 Tax=Sporomusa malonica TaxID=112901 RepID=A0A1W2BSA1_9FIRM|nr:acyl-CoA dehydratase activase-related protein [Sporomusa malonica]SMC75823.1 Predicted nucleotide-binding protein, sugar kinase/HSP70/actin superfamily [Sporomusa malonica]